MKSEALTTINQLRIKLASDLKMLIEEFQRRPECRGIQVALITMNQDTWNNGYDPSAPGQVNVDLMSGPDRGYRLQSLKVTLLFPG